MSVTCAKPFLLLLGLAVGAPSVGHAAQSIDLSVPPFARPPGVFAPVDSGPSPGFATIVRVASKRARAATEIGATPSDIGGRYAVMRETHDTGCMLTLDDKSRVRGGDRAQLAPGCRDQGIVVFDPTAWQIVKGELVLTARAGHKTHLHKVGEGGWQKDATDGKPLGLKKL